MSLTITKLRTTIGAKTVIIAYQILRRLIYRYSQYGRCSACIPWGELSLDRVLTSLQAFAKQTPYSTSAHSLSY